MMTANQKLKRKQFGTVWAELAYLCEKIHHWLWTRRDMSPARRFQSRLHAVLNALPENRLAILREEGWALLHELEGELAAAIEHRKKEIRLIERLHESVKLSIDGGKYDAAVGDSILEKWDAGALKERRDILKALLLKNGRRGAGTKVRRNGIDDAARSRSHSSKHRAAGRKRPA